MKGDDTKLGHKCRRAQLLRRRRPVLLRRLQQRHPSGRSSSPPPRRQRSRPRSSSAALATPPSSFRPPLRPFRSSVLPCRESPSPPPLLTRSLRSCSLASTSSGSFILDLCGDGRAYTLCAELSENALYSNKAGEIFCLKKLFLTFTCMVE